MSIDTYKLTSTEEPTDEVLSQLMREAAEEAAQKRAEATAQFFSKLKSDAQKIEADMDKELYTPEEAYELTMKDIKAIYDDACHAQNMHD